MQETKTFVSLCITESYEPSHRPVTLIDHDITYRRACLPYYSHEEYSQPYFHVFIFLNFKRV